MRCQLRIGAILLAVALRAQLPPTAPERRAQDLVARTGSGQEEKVACDQFDETVGNALLQYAEQAGAASIERLTVAYGLARRAGTCTGSASIIGRALNGLSDVLLGRGQFDKALEAARESIRIHQNLPGNGLAEAWNRCGNAQWWLNDNQAALEDFQRALELSAAANDQLGQARAHNNIGNIHRSTGELDLALDQYMRALSIFQTIGDRARAAVVTHNIGLVYFNRGEYDTALQYNQRGLEMNRALGNQIRVASDLDSAGNIYCALGAYRLALQSLLQSLGIRKSLGDRPGVMETSHNIGLVHFSLGDYALAIDAYKQGLRLNREMGGHDANLVAEGLRNIGAAAWRLGQRQRAEANFREGLTIAQTNHVGVTEGQLLHDLGQVALASGRLAHASRMFESALQYRRRIGDQAGITETLTALASTRLAEHRETAALDFARQAIANASTHDQPELLWQAQTVLGTVCRRLRQADAARLALTEAIRSVEKLSTQTIAGENLRQQFFENKLSPYHELLTLLVEENSFAGALELAERSKARVLAQLLRGNRAGDDAVLTADERRERAHRRDALYSLNRQIENEHEKQNRNRSRIDALEAARHAAREDLAAYEASLAAQHPEVAARRGEVRSLTMADVDRLLPDPGAAIVEYVVTDRQLFVFVITKNGTRGSVTGRSFSMNADDLMSRIERFRKRIGTRDFGVAEDARALYQVLLAPIWPRISGKSRLIIVPDGVLWNVPFQALLSPQGYLIESAAVSYAPSITVLREILQLRGAPRTRTLLAVGKTQFGSLSSTLDPLPEAETQVRRLQEMYGPQRSLTYIGGEATESQFKAAAPQYTILHLATHGVLDEASPLYSYLVLSPAAGHPDDDGRLEAWEIMRMKLSAELVVLAACDTGRGRIAPGEGLIGTMWALFAAGARAIVVSQFRVESKSASELLLAFHRRLATGGGSKALEFQRAALGLLRTPRYAHPYYWAGFILAGDTD